MTASFGRRAACSLPELVLGQGLEAVSSRSGCLGEGQLAAALEL